MGRAMSEGKILVAAASGNIGGVLVERLLARGQRVKAATPEGIRVGAAEPIVLDYRRPETFAAALNGVDRASIVVPHGIKDVVELLTPLVYQLIIRRVKIVFHSAFGANRNKASPYLAIERMIANSGTPYIILRPAWFADNFHTFWRGMILSGCLKLPAGSACSTFIDVRDIAECAAEGLCSSRHDGRDFDLTGPEVMTYAQAAGVIAKAANRDLVYEPVDDEAFLEAATRFNLSISDARGFIVAFERLRAAPSVETVNGVMNIIGRPATPLAVYASEMAHAWEAVGERSAV